MADKLVNQGLIILSESVSQTNTHSTPHWICWGTNSTNATITDTGLGTPASEAPAVGTVSLVQTSSSADTYQVAGTLTVAGSGKTIAEVALIDTSSTATGRCFTHSNFTGIALNVGDSIAFTIKTQFSSGS